MALLIANLGNSDLSLRPIDQPYYLPIGFSDRDEPNLEQPPAGSEAAEVWQNRDALICQQFCQPFGVEVGDNNRFSFRVLTHHLWEAYQADPDTWHDRIRPTRIWGVIKAAQEQFAVKQVYVFVTDQPHDGDTIYTYEILKQWFAREEPDLNFTGEILPKTLKAIDQDGLFDYYDQFFYRIGHELNQTNPEAEVFISIKGGTPQMQTALRMQSMASMIRFQANLEPQMSVVRVLEGEPSPCKAGVYWQYARSQKFQAVRVLLNTRWDFDGAEQLLQDWQQFLQRLVERELADQEITAGNQQLEHITLLLQMAQDWMNLDDYSAKRLLEKYIANVAVAQQKEVKQKILGNTYDKLLNLYTQCRILWELDQIANFLPRMGSFCEAAIDRVIAHLGITGANRSNRFKKRELVQNGVDCSNNKEMSPQWERLKNALERLDFWADRRNQLIHGAQGISKEQMQELYEQRSENDVTCAPDEILTVMETICRNPLVGLDRQICDRYVGHNARYYLYSEIRDLVLRQLL